MGRLAAGFLAFGLAISFSSPVMAAPAAKKPPVAPSLVKAPLQVRDMADWVGATSDNAGLPFVIVDKTAAKAFAFDGSGKLLGSAWVLVGLATGDDSAPGVGDMPLAQITPDIRTTPAGRFVTVLGRDLTKDVLWVDYADAISMHPVINTDPSERRLERIVSPRPAEHRISYGCINVPAKFFSTVLAPAFTGTKGIVYILPEVKPMQAVFPTYRAPGESGSVEDHDPAGIVHRPGLQTAEKTLAE